MIISRWLARKRKQEAEIKQSYDRLGPGKYEAYKAKRTRKRLGFVRSLALVWIGVGMAFYIMATGGNALVAFLLYLVIFSLAHIDTALQYFNRG